MFQDYHWRRNLLWEEARFTFPQEYFTSDSAIVSTADLHGPASPSNTLAQGWGGVESRALLPEYSNV